MDTTDSDITIIGSGPAGLTAGIYAVRGAASTVLLAGEKWGGQLMLTSLVENYPGFPDGINGPDLMVSMRKQAENLGVKAFNENATFVDFSVNPFIVQTTNREIHSKSVIIATGAQTLWLGVPGETNLIGKGVSSCAPCDAPFFKDKNVAVIGGGDSAMEEALVLASFAKSVTVIHRRDSFRASAIMQQKVLSSPKIKVLWNTTVEEVKGVNKLEKIVLKNISTNKQEEKEFDGMFVAVGHKPDSDIFNGKIETDEKGYIKKIENAQFNFLTSVNGVFVAGDVHDHHYKQAVTASAFGCMAALDALKYIESLKK